jgi:hypothetical protein
MYIDWILVQRSGVGVRKVELEGSRGAGRGGWVERGVCIKRNVCASAN